MRGAWGLRPPLQLLPGDEILPHQVQTPNPEGTCRPQSTPQAAWSHLGTLGVSLLTQAPPSRGPLCKEPKTPTVLLPASTARGQCWLPALLSLPLEPALLLPGPQPPHRASHGVGAGGWEGGWGEPRHSLPWGTESLGRLKLPLCCVDSGQDAGTGTRARWGQGDVAVTALAPECSSAEAPRCFRSLLALCHCGLRL